jgi:hypothetical protein
MRILANQTGVQAPDADYPKGRIVNNQTIINEEINGDIIITFQKLVDLAGISENGNPDNETNGYQLLQALAAYIRSLLSTTSAAGVVEKATTAEAQAGTADKFLDAALLQLVTATETRKGIVEKATTVEAQAGTADKFLDAALLQLVTSTETRKGIVEKATNAEGLAGTADKFIDAAVLAHVISQLITPTNPDNLITRAIQMGVWDMDNIVGVNVSYTPPGGKRVINPSASIFTDVGYNCWPITFNSGLPTNANPQGSIQYNAGSNRFELSRLSTGYFDNSAFSSAVINRGYITFQLIDI